MATRINRRQIRQYALHRAQTRAHKFTRVGSGFYAKCEANLREYITNQGHRHPSKGRTIE